MTTFNLKKFLKETTPADRRSRLEEAEKLAEVYQGLLMYHGMSAAERARLEALYEVHCRMAENIELAIESAKDGD